MARPVEFPGADGPEDTDPPRPGVGPLPVKRFAKSNVSCWKLDPEELAMVQRTGVIWLINETFDELKSSKTGERWQPRVSVTAREDEANGW